MDGTALESDGPRWRSLSASSTNDRCYTASAELLRQKLNVTPICRIRGNMIVAGRR